MSGDPVDDQLAALAAQATPSQSGDPVDAALAARAAEKPRPDPSKADTKRTPGDQGFLSTLAGEAEIAGATVGNIIPNAGNGLIDIASRATGFGPRKDVIPQFTVGEAGRNLAQDVSSRLPNQPTVADQTQAIRDARLGTPNATVADVVHQTGQVAGDVGDVAGAVGVVKGGWDMLRGSGAAGDAQAAADAAAAAGNAGAAGAAVDTSALTPETRAELARLNSTGVTPNADALQRIHKAESLPEPVRLTAGEARQDSGMMSDEFNNKKIAGNAIGNRYDETDRALQTNVEHVASDVAPSAGGRSTIQNGQFVINGIRAYDAPKVAEIDAQYADAKSRNNGELFLDTAGAADKITAGLKPQGIGRYSPFEAQGIVDDIAGSNGKLSIDDVEGYRSQLADLQREARMNGKGNTSKALQVVRDQVEALAPTSDTAAAAKSSFDKARSLNKAREDEIEANPAYEAAVNDPAYNPRKPETLENPFDLADKFIPKYVLGGPQQGTVRLRKMLTGNTDANEAITAEALRPVQDAASRTNGFSSIKVDAAMKSLNARPELVNNPEALETLNNVNDVGKWTHGQRRGGTFGNSGSGSILMNAAKGIGKGALNWAADSVNTATPGLRLGDKALNLLFWRKRSRQGKPGAKARRGPRRLVKRL